MLVVKKVEANLFYTAAWSAARLLDYPNVNKSWCVVKALLFAPRARRVVRPQPLQHWQVAVAGRDRARTLTPRAGWVVRPQPLHAGSLGARRVTPRGRWGLSR